MRWFWQRQAAEPSPPPPATSGVFVGPSGEATPLVSETSYPNAYAGNVWAYIGVCRVSQAVASIPWTVETRTGAEWKPAPDHPLSRLLRYVNAGENFYLAKEATASWLMLDGNAYWHLGRARPNEPPVTFHVLFSTYTRIEPDDRPPYYKAYLYRPKGPGTEAIRYRPQDIVHHKLFSAHDPYYGMPPVKPLVSNLNQYGYADSFNSGFLGRGGTPVGILQAEGRLPEEERKRLDTWWRRITGRSQAGKPIVMGAGLKWVEVGKSIDQVVAKDLPMFLREGILAAVGCPPLLAGVTAGANYANARIQERLMYTQAVLPLDNRMLAKVNEWVEDEWGETVRIVHDLSGIPALKDDMLQLADIADRTVARGIFTINEVRADFFNKPPVAWGDDFWGPISTVPVATASGGVNELAAVTATDNLRGRGRVGQASACHPTRDGDRLKPVLRATRAWRRLSEEARGAVHRGYNTYRDREAQVLKKRMWPWYEQQGQTMIAKIREEPDLRSMARMKQPKVVVLLFDADEGTAALEKIVAPVLADLYARTGQQAIATTGVDIAFDIDNPRARELLRARTLEMKSVTETAQDRVRASLEEGLAAGETTDDLTGRVLEWVRDGRENYAEVTARTETGIVMNGAATESYRQAGATGKEWLAIVDDRTRDSHAEMDGVVVGIDESFDVDGNDCDGPGDPSLPPEEICNCRCTVAAAFEETS